MISLPVAVRSTRFGEVIRGTPSDINRTTLHESSKLRRLRIQTSDQCCVLCGIRFRTPPKAGWYGGLLDRLMRCSGVLGAG